MAHPEDLMQDIFETQRKVTIEEKRKNSKENFPESYKPEWERYYQYLERLRSSGECNMFGAVPYLREEFQLSREEASTILANWMENYDFLCEHFGWEQ